MHGWPLLCTTASAVKVSKTQTPEARQGSNLFVPPSLSQRAELDPFWVLDVKRLRNAFFFNSFPVLRWCLLACAFLVVTFLLFSSFFWLVIAGYTPSMDQLVDLRFPAPPRHEPSKLNNLVPRQFPHPQHALEVNNPPGPSSARN